MKIISKADLSQLAGITEASLVSIYMPIYHGDDGRRQNTIRLKNLLVAARETQVATGWKELDSRKLLAPAVSLLDAADLWKCRAAGLALFASRDGVRQFAISSAPKESAVVGRRFHIVPLIASASHDRSFFLLAVSQNQVRLFHGRPNQLAEVHVPEMPTSLVETLGATEADLNLYFRTGQPQMHGKESLVFHGQGGSSDVFKPRLAAFARAIDRAITGRLAGQSATLVFAGVDYLFPIYRSESSYPHLLPTHISGNTDSMPLDAMRLSAVSLIDAAARDKRCVATAKYWDLVTRGRTSNHLNKVLAAAQSGGVETLFVDPEECCLGSFDSTTLQTRVDEQRRDDSEDLVNLAATLVLTHGGEVESLPAGYIPGGGVIAAIMRYPVPQFGQIENNREHNMVAHP